MDLRATEGVASRFKAYIEHLRNAVGHADRRERLAAYCAGLLLPGEQKRRADGGAACGQRTLAPSTSRCIIL